MSAPFNLSTKDTQKIGMGAIVALGGVAVCILLAVGAVWVHLLAPSLLPPVAVGALLSGVSAVLLNAARKWLGQTAE